MNRYSVINPVVKTLLCSPFHRLMSRNTVLIEFQGRKSGKTFQMPVSYHEAQDRVHLFTDLSNVWWRNLESGADVKLQLRGRAQGGKSHVTVGATPEKQEALTAFLVASPRDAAHARVGFDADGRPSAPDIAHATERLVHISIELTEP